MQTLTMGEELRKDRQRHQALVRVAVWVINAIAAILGTGMVLLVVG